MAPGMNLAKEDADIVSLRPSGAAAVMADKRTSLYRERLSRCVLCVFDGTARSTTRVFLLSVAWMFTLTVEVFANAGPRLVGRPQIVTRNK